MTSSLIPVDEKRLSEVEGNPHYAAELATLDEPRVSAYYRHVIGNVELDRANPKNSYVMYVAGKVDVLDPTKPPTFVPQRVSLPDIDNDFPIRARDSIIEYIRAKYSRDRVAQMATYSRLQGRGALKEVLRAWGRCSYDEMNRITEHIPDEAAIADELQEMAEAGEEPSIIMWALENTPGPLREWCWLDEKGELDGPLARDFAQAIRLEGTRKNQGKHASGVVVCSLPLSEVCPMTIDKKGGELVVGVDMRDAEDLGLVKLDILGSLTIDRIEAAVAIMRGEAC